MDQLCNTRLQLCSNLDYGSSSALLHDCRRDSSHPATKPHSVCEVNSTPTPDTSFHLSFCWVFPCTHVLVVSIYILNKTNIHTLRFVINISAHIRRFQYCYQFCVDHAHFAQLRTEATKYGSTSESVNLSVSQPISQSVGRPINQSINQSVSQSVSQSVNQSVNQSINQSVSQSVRQSVSQSVSQSVNQSISQSISQSVSQSVNQSILSKRIKIIWNQ